MDIYSLAAANLTSKPRPARKDARAEDRYYARHDGRLPVLPPRMIGAFTSVTVVCLVLLTSSLLM